MTDTQTTSRIAEADLRPLLGEGFHTAFRKAVDSSIANQIWGLIDRMPAEEWAAVIDFVASGTVSSLDHNEPPTMTLEQVREEATRRLEEGIEAAGGEDAPLAAEMVDILEDIEDDEFWGTSDEINPPAHAVLWALMGVTLKDGADITEELGEGIAKSDLG